MIALLIVQPFLTMILGMWGGQGFLAARRFILPCLLSATGALYCLVVKSHPWWVSMPFLLLSAVFSQGYGPNSWINKWLKIDWEDRAFYSFLTSLPLIIAACLAQKWLLALLSFSLLMYAFEYEGGLWFSFTINGKKFDVLKDDVVRYLTVGVLASWIIS